MKKQFAIKSAQVVKNIKSTVAKRESNSTLSFSMLAQCCQQGPMLDFSKPVFSL